MKYAGIGARRTPVDIQQQFIKLAFNLAKEKHCLYSGAADGADTAFELGVRRAISKYTKQEDIIKYLKIFLPWNGYNTLGDWTKGVITSSPSNKAVEIAKELLGESHWVNMRDSYNKKYSKKRELVPAHLLHSRSVHQILGEECDSPIDFVVYWAIMENNEPIGGTRTAVVLARQYNIPTFNFIKAKEKEEFYTFLKSR